MLDSNAPVVLPLRTKADLDLTWSIQPQDDDSVAVDIVLDPEAARLRIRVNIQLDGQDRSVAWLLMLALYAMQGRIRQDWSELRREANWSGRRRDRLESYERLFHSRANV